MKTILVTGFGPFNGHNINASWEAVKLLPDEVDDFVLVKTEIPVIYDKVERKIPTLWKELNPQVVIHVGVSSFTAEFKLETQANRLGYTKADCLGNFHCTGSVCCEGEDNIFTGLDVKIICEHVNKIGTVKASPSNDAGRYLCEFIYYTSLNIDRERVLFVHVPPLNNPYTAKELSNGLLCIIKAILENREIIESTTPMSSKAL